MKEKLFALPSSRRFWAALASLFVVFAHEVLGMDLEQAQTLVGILMAWVLGDSITKTERSS